MHLSPPLPYLRPCLRFLNKILTLTLTLTIKPIFLYVIPMFQETIFHMHKCFILIKFSRDLLSRYSQHFRGFKAHKFFVSLVIRTVYISLKIRPIEKVTGVDWCVEFVFTPKPYGFKASDDTATLTVVKPNMSGLTKYVWFSIVLGYLFHFIYVNTRKFSTWYLHT